MRQTESCMTIANAPTTTDSRAQPAPPSTPLRWCKFNLVGGMGIVVQFAALFLLRTGLHFNYLFATGVAVEAAVVHNFVWHEQFTWSDRVSSDRFSPGRPSAGEKNAGGVNSYRRERHAIADRWRRSLTRFFCFNLTTGAVSILGNLALMKVMVGQGHMNYLLANAIAIALCSVANFLVSEQWVFTE